MPELSIAIPIYNEGKSILNTIKSLVKELGKNKIDYELILVNNGSKDNTDKYIKRLVKNNRRLKRVSIKKNKGYGWGIINGLNICTGKYIGWIDGDGQIRPKDVVSCLDCLKNNPKMGLCKGIRKEKFGTNQRKIVSYGFDFLFTTLFLNTIKDINAKPKIIKKELCKDLELKSKEWSIDAELLIKCIRKKIKIGNVEVKLLPRKKGRSNVRAKVIFDLFVYLIKARFGSF